MIIKDAEKSRKMSIWWSTLYVKKRTPHPWSESHPTTQITKKAIYSWVKKRVLYTKCRKIYENYFYLDLKKDYSGHKELHTPVMIQLPSCNDLFFRFRWNIKTLFKKIEDRYLQLSGWRDTKHGQFYYSWIGPKGRSGGRSEARSAEWRPERSPSGPVLDPRVIFQFFHPSWK